MQDKVEVVILSPNQWQDYKNIRLKALQSDPLAYAWTYEELDGQLDSWWINRLADKTSYYLIAKIGDEPVGTAGIHLKSTGAGEGTACIVGVFVDREYRRQGIGQKMLTKLINILQEKSGVHTVRICVSDTEEPAKALYKKLGFEYVDRIKNEVKVGDRYYNELILEKNLQ